MVASPRPNGQHGKACLVADESHLPIIGVLLLILGVMVACTDIEVRFVRWFNCGPLSTPNEQTSEVCR